MARWKLRRKPPTAATMPAERHGAGELSLAALPEPVDFAPSPLNPAANQLLGLQAALEEMAHLNTVAKELRPAAVGPVPVPERIAPRAVESFLPGEVTETGDARLIRLTGEIEVLIEDAQEAPAAAAEVETAAVQAVDPAQAALAMAAGSLQAFEILNRRCPAKWAEAFRKLRGRILEERARWEAGGRRLQSIAVVSPRRQGGRSATARNLAACLAALPETRVLLVDADAAKPSLHRHLQIARAPGLTEAMAVQDDAWGGHLHRAPESSLYALTLGATAASGIDALDLPRLPAFLERAGAAFEWIVIDAPPLDSADGEALAGVADGVLLVLRREREYFDEAGAAVRRLDPSRLLGAVLNFSS